MSIGPLIRRCLARYDDNFVAFTRSQYEALAAIEGNPGVSQHRLSEITAIDRSTMSEMLIRLDQMGFIRRERIRLDTRTKGVQLTLVGKAALERSHQVAKKAETALLKPLKAPERKALAGFLTRMAEDRPCP